MIGERLKQLRIKNGLKQQELANMFGLSSGTISFYESEQRKPDIDFIVAVAKYFDVSFAWLNKRNRQGKYRYKQGYRFE